jgi:hypothetical protein
MMLRTLLIKVVVFLCTCSASFGATYFISPSGTDSNLCTAAQSSAAPKRTFASLFGCGKAGDTFVLLDGVYDSSTTGYINPDTQSICGGKCAQPPNGTATAYTTVRAQNDGAVRIRGQAATYGGSLRVGSGSTTGQYLIFEGLRFENYGADVYAANHVIIRRCAIHANNDEEAVFGIGNNDNDRGTRYITVEDSWIWGNARVMIIAFRSDHVIFRRVVARHDGCNSSASGKCGSNSGNYVVGSTIYNSSDVSFQNVVITDSVRGPNGFAGAADFQTAWHTSADGNQTRKQFGRLEWLGVISLNTELVGMHAEMDSEPGALNPAFTFRNAVAWDARAGACNAQMGSTEVAADVVYENVICKNHPSATTEDVLRLAPNTSGGQNIVRNAIAIGPGRYGINSVTQPSYVANYGATTAYNQTTCATGCRTANPLSDGTPPSLKYIARVENGSALKGAGLGGADIGANVVYRYGTDGSFHGDAGFNALTATLLWPWPNEARLKKEMCSDAGVTRGFCSKASLTEYIWTYLGNPVPSDFGPPPPASSPCDLNRDNIVNSTDVALARDQLLEVSPCTTADLQPDGKCDVVDLQRIVNASLGQACRTGP